MENYYSTEELKLIGFNSFGENVKISKKASIYNASNISIASNVRIDDFCILSGKIEIGSYIHIAPYSSLTGGTEGIFLHDFVNISRKVEIFAASDDFSGKFMTNPTVSTEYTNVINAKVVLKKHVIIGCGSVVLPNVTLEEGTAIGAMSLVKKSTEAWSMCFGIPCKRIGTRKKDLLQFEKYLK